MFARSIRIVACLIGGIFVLPGCSQESPEPAQDLQVEVPVTPADVEVTEAMEQMLAKADAVDGAVDHTVSKCASCLLSMDGSSEYALTVGDYTMHFCSADCQQNFGADLAQSVLAMKVPDEPVGETP